MKRDAIVRGSLSLLGLMIWCAAPANAGPPSPATDEEIKKMIAAAGDAKKYDNAALAAVLDEADVYVQDSGLATTESCEVVKILTDAGSRAKSVYRMEFDPATNRITLKSVRIHRQGGTVEDVPISGMITPPAKQHALYWGNREHLLSIPRLEIGDCLEIRTSKIGYNIAYLDGSSDQPGGTGGAGEAPADGETLQPPMPGHWYEVTEFQAGHPIIKKRYSVYMPKDKPVQYEVYNGTLKSSLWFTDKYHVYTFWADDIPPLKPEPYSTGSSDIATKLVMATLPDWFAKSRWFFKANESQFEADDAIRAKVRELTDGLPDEEAKIKACLHWVADNVRYYGTSRGPCEGFTLHKGMETFRDRGGVCKDKAGMLVTMLRVLGLEVYPALTMAGTRVEAIPADQFNHTITVMRNQDGTFRILDPTWSPLSKETWSSWEAQQGLVYGTPEGQDLTLSQYYPPEHNKLAYNGESQISDDGALTTRIVMDMSNSPCTAFRRTIDRNPKPDQPGMFEETLAIAPNAKIEELSHTDPFDYSKDSHIEMKVSAQTYASGGDAVWMFRLPMMQRPLGSFLLSDFNYSLTPERKLGLRMRATRLLQIEEKLALPPGWKVERVPEAKKMDSGSASLTFEATPGDGVLTYKLQMKVKNNIIPPEDYAGFKKAMDTINELRDEWIICSVGGDGARKN